MRLTRRNALIGLGTAAAGAGVIGGTGAFTSVEADRSVSVQTSGDSGAGLGLSAEGSYDDYVNVTDDGIVELTFDNVSGLNKQAETTVDPLITVANNGTNNINLGLELTDDDGDDFAQYISFMIDETDTESNDIAADGDYTLSVGGSLTLGLLFDIPADVDSSTFEMTLTITAEAQQ